MGARAALENNSVEFTSGFVLGCLLIDVYIHALLFEMRHRQSCFSKLVFLVCILRVLGSL